MTEAPKAAILERLKHSVQLLASPPEVQLQRLPAYVCKADELALEFDQWREVALHNCERDFTAEQHSSLSALDQKLDMLTAAGQQHWTDEAVRKSPGWNDVRHLAAHVLDVFGWPLETPPSYASEYKSEDQIQKYSIN